MRAKGRCKIDARNRPFSPQYPLWSDGAAKRRWIRLPEGAAIDAGDVSRWEFPIGTKFWKEFSFDGRKVETRFLWRVSQEQWVFASYAWNEAQTEAVAGAGNRHRRMSPKWRRASATVFRRSRLPVVPRLGAHRDPRLRRAESLRRSRSECAARRAADARDDHAADVDRREPDHAEAHRARHDAAAHRGVIAASARGARISVDQLRQLPQSREFDRVAGIDSEALRAGSREPDRQPIECAAGARDHGRQARALGGPGGAGSIAHHQSRSSRIERAHPPREVATARRRRCRRSARVLVDRAGGRSADVVGAVNPEEWKATIARCIS